MRHKFVAVCGMMALTAGSMFADFSYHETSKVTGGAMAAMLKVAGVFSKSAREPIEATVALKGNKLAHRSQSHMSLIDLDAGTITEVDLQKKQYSVLTFAEMKQVMENMAKKMNKDQKAQMNIRASAEPTGKTKDINGFNAKEVLMKIAMETTDQKSGQKGSMVVMTDLWIAEVPGYSEIADFYKKMAEQINWKPGGGMFMQQPELAKGMAEAFKEVAKMNGAPVFQKTAMGPEGMAPPSSDGPTPAAKEENKPKVSAGSVLGGALGGRLGGFGRKKQQDPPPQEEQKQQQGQPAGQGALLEMETQYSNFATTADPSLFVIPAGFKQVESEMKKIK